MAASRGQHHEDRRASSSTLTFEASWLLVRTVHHNKSQGDPTKRRGLPAFPTLRSRVVALDGSSAPPSIPQHRHALAKGLMQPVVLLKVAAPHEDADHGLPPL